MQIGELVDGALLARSIKGLRLPGETLGTALAAGPTLLLFLRQPG